MVGQRPTWRMSIINSYHPPTGEDISCSLCLAELGHVPPSPTLLGPPVAVLHCLEPLTHYMGCRVGFQRPALDHSACSSPPLTPIPRLWQYFFTEMFNHVLTYIASTCIKFRYGPLYVISYRLARWASSRPIRHSQTRVRSQR